MPSKKPKVAVFFAEGFEEIEGVVPADLLRRAGVDVRVCSITDSRRVVGSHGIEFKVDWTWKKFKKNAGGFDALVLPGGSAGTENLGAFKPLRKALRRHFAAGKLVAAICAAPMVLGDAGLLEERRYACFPGCQSDDFGGQYQPDAAVVADGNVITGRAAGAAMEFGRALVRQLAPAAAEEVDEGVQYGIRGLA